MIKQNHTECVGSRAHTYAYMQHTHTYTSVNVLSNFTVFTWGWILSYPRAQSKNTSAQIWVHSAPPFLHRLLTTNEEGVFQWSWETLERAPGCDFLPFPHCTDSQRPPKLPRRLCSQTWFLGSCSYLPHSVWVSLYMAMCTININQELSIFLLGNFLGIWLATMYLFDKLPLPFFLSSSWKGSHNRFNLPIQNQWIILVMN